MDVSGAGVGAAVGSCRLSFLARPWRRFWTAVPKWRRRYFLLLDKWAAHVLNRWIGFFLIAFNYSFIRLRPEFKFWHSILVGFRVAYMLTFCGFFDVPVYWPVLLSSNSPAMQMIKYRYIPFTIVKKRYAGNRAASSNDSDIVSE